VKVVQELLRHASIKITLDIYTQAMTPAKREAQSRVVAMIRPELRSSGTILEEEAGKSVHESVHGNLSLKDAKCLKRFGVPDGIRTRVIAVKGRCPRPG
jgi:hypothetical protein